MKSSKGFPALWLSALLLCTAAWAQVRPAAPQKPSHAPTAQSKPGPAPVASRSAQRPSHAAPVAAGRTQVASRQHQQLAAKNAPPARRTVRVVERRVKHPASVRKQTAKKDVGHKGERDPFVSPVVDRGSVHVSCTGSGRQCLDVGEINLQGVVHGPNGFIAVVASGEHTYFLRENDPLANGEVEHITRDSIVLRERYFNELGRPQTRQVVRRLSVPAV